MKLQRLTVEGQGERWFFWCPGCKELHSFAVRTDGVRPAWSFDGDLERPTFSPSLLIFTSRPRPGLPADPGYDMRPEDWVRVTLCHLFLRAGRLEFCGDSPHALAGQTVDLPDIPPGEEV